VRAWSWSVGACAVVCIAAYLHGRFKQRQVRAGALDSGLKTCHACHGALWAFPLTIKHGGITVCLNPIQQCAGSGRWWG
jgi:hypothetical protein